MKYIIFGPPYSYQEVVKSKLNMIIFNIDSNASKILNDEKELLKACELYGPGQDPKSVLSNLPKNDTVFLKRIVLDYIFNSNLVSEISVFQTYLPDVLLSNYIKDAHALICKSSIAHIMTEYDKDENKMFDANRVYTLYKLWNNVDDNFVNKFKSYGVVVDGEIISGLWGI